MTSYAASINIRHISTGRPPSGRSAHAMLSLSEATAKARGSLRYITRADAAADLDIIGHSQGVTMIAKGQADRRAMMEMSRWAIAERAKRHTDANGIRLADKLIISLPQDATAEHHREMVAKIVSDLGQDSDAWLVAAIHRDKAGNPHAHILAIDGLETREAAISRRPDAKRIRRRDQLRLNEGGNRPDLRRRIAAQINKVSEREGYRLAEVRSLEDQGIKRAPQTHEGPHGSARRSLREVTSWMDKEDAIYSNLDMKDFNTPPRSLMPSGPLRFAEHPPSHPTAEHDDDTRDGEVR